MSKKGSSFGLGDGIGFGIVGGAIGVNQCESDDYSWYCMLSRGFSAFMMLFTFIAILYIAFSFIVNIRRNNLFSKTKSG